MQKGRRRTQGQGLWAQLEGPLLFLLARFPQGLRCPGVRSLSLRQIPLLGNYSPHVKPMPLTGSE